MCWSTNVRTVNWNFKIFETFSHSYTMKNVAIVTKCWWLKKNQSTKNSTRYKWYSNKIPININIQKCVRITYLLKNFWNKNLQFIFDFCGKTFFKYFRHHPSKKFDYIIRNDNKQHGINIRNNNNNKQQSTTNMVLIFKTTTTLNIRNNNNKQHQQKTWY